MNNTIREDISDIALTLFRMRYAENLRRERKQTIIAVCGIIAFAVWGILRRIRDS